MSRGTDEDRRRTFIAVLLGPDIRTAASRMRGPLTASADRLRWVSPSHLHLTLQFLGDITVRQVEDAAEAARVAAASTAPFTVTFAGLGAFPSPAAPRIVWVGVTAGADRLAALAGSLAAALRDRRIPLDPRPFSPHLTLARTRGQGRPPDLTREQEALARVVIGEQPVTELVVVNSVLGAFEPVHTVVATGRLGEGSRGAG
ncbi:MAG TPA: RNA 2',3'-cyclic phosphodiesterase [bacterium]|nr:RNA 2',3'-cyclic phosphodiesterase [bacterium]